MFNYSGIGYIGNKYRVIQPWYLPKKFLLCTAISPKLKKTVIVKNPNDIPLIVGLPVYIMGGIIKSVYIHG